MTEAFQDLMQHNLCYGCGAANAAGLHIKSYWDGDEGVCTFQPAAHHMAGPRHIVNGGIIGLIVDCHAVCTAIADAYKQQGRPIGSEPMIWYATGSLKMDYLRPTPIDHPIKLRAKILERGEKKTRLSCSVQSHGQECAKGDILAVRVPNEWFTGA